VVGIDGEPASLAALSVALEVAAEASASVEAIYVGEQASVVDKAVAYVRTQAPLAHLAGALAGVRRSPPDGKPADVLLDIAKRTQAALLVMGTTGRTGLTHMVLGSVAEEVCRSATLPVLVVRATGSTSRR
jgi:nucleotide-binding universal stress UspA family protein